MQSAMSQQYKLFFLFSFHYPLKGPADGGSVVNGHLVFTLSSSFHLQNFTLLKADFERAG